jgi:DNA replication protein DnaC
MSFSRPIQPDNLKLLILHDWGLESLDRQARHGLPEILEERYGGRSTIVTSQLPVGGTM